MASVKGHFGFIDFREGEEMRHIFFHATGVEGEVTLRVGDEVTFIVLDRGKNKELVACKIIRTKVRATRQDRGMGTGDRSWLAQADWPIVQ